jgi:AGZA family xanthine/uracil permease-like MFS transporter
MMMSNAARVEWDDASESVPAFLTMTGIPLAYSIADGLALGFITYPVLKVLTGRGREIGKMSYGIAVLLVIYFVFVRTRLA